MFCGQYKQLSSANFSTHNHAVKLRRGMEIQSVWGDRQVF